MDRVSARSGGRKTERAGIRDAAKKNPLLKNGFYRTTCWSPARTHVDTKEGTMFNFIINRKNSVPRPSLYCVWIRAHEGENAPLIRVWIDPSMSIFDSQAKVHEPDLAAAQAEAEAALTHEGNS
jgi:hypothetical protein